MPAPSRASDVGSGAAYTNVPPPPPAASLPVAPLSPSWPTTMFRTRPAAREPVPASEAPVPPASDPPYANPVPPPAPTAVIVYVPAAGTVNVCTVPVYPNASSGSVNRGVTRVMTTEPLPEPAPGVA